MLNLFKTELLRHRTLACGVALFHFAVLYYLYTLGASVISSMQALVWLLVCMGLSAGFGIFQMSCYRRDNDWLYLLHRPLLPRRIFLALALAGSCISLFIAVLPFALYVVIMHADQMFGIEGRHYRSIPYAMAASLTAYCCGCFTVLSASRFGFLAVAMLLVFLQVGTNADLMVSSSLLLIYAWALARVAFQPDRSKPPEGLFTLLLTELPLRCGLLLFITAATSWLLYAGNYLSGNDRVRMPTPGSDDFVRTLAAKDVMQLALQHSTHAQAMRLSQQVTLGETVDVGLASFNRYPRRGQLPFVDEGLILADGRYRYLWRFRHDLMLFEGRDMDTAVLIGWLAPDGIHDNTALPATRFDSVPWATADGYVISDNDIYQITWEDRQVHHRYHDLHSDRFNNSLTQGENITTLYSDQRLYLFSSAALRDPTSVLVPEAVLDVPDVKGADLRKLAVLPLNGNYLISALLDATPFSNAPAFASLGHARLQLQLVRQNADPELLALVPLPSGASEWFLYKDLVLAPGIRLFNDLVTGLREHKSPPVALPMLHLRLPPKIYLASALVALLSAGITAQMSRHSTLAPRVRLFWIIGNALTGFAGLLSFLFGYYWKRGDFLSAQPGRSASADANAAESRPFGYNH